MKRRIIPNPPRLGRIANFLFWFLVAAVVHFAFRYIFQISDSGTSPGYQDTPLLLSSIKDGLFLILAVSVIISALISRQFKTSPLGVVVVAVFVIMLAFACLRIALDVFAFDVLLSIRSLWVPTLLVLIVELIPRKQAGVVLLRVGQVLTPIVLLFQAVTVVLYLVAHRLPALSYVGNPRFGGILDDPNGYGVLCVLLMAVIWGRTHLGWLVALAVNVLMTVSLSAITILLIYLAFQFVRQIRWNRAKTLVGWTFLGTLTLISGISVWNQFGEQIIHWWEQKSPSVQDHASSSFGGLYTLSQNNFAQLAIGNVGFSENQWVLTALNSGFIGLVLQIILLVWLLIRCLKQDWSVGAWGVAVVVASALIPYLYVYPISVLFWAMLALGARQTRREIHGNTINRLMSDTSNITVPHPDYQGR